MFYLLFCVTVCVLNIEFPRNVQIHVRSIVIVPYVKYAFCENVRIHKISVG